MREADFDGFVDVLQVVGEQYGKKLSEGVIALYWQGLQDYELNAVKDALGKHLRNPDTGMFMPKIADIIRMLQGSTQDAALIAWSKIDRAVRHVGVYETVVFDDALIHAVLASMGGWLWLCGQDNEAWPHIARNFEVAYRGFKARGETPAYPPTLIGISEAHNGKAGFAIKPPTLIGDVAKARMTMEGGSNKPVIAITAMSAPEALRIAA
jgi:Domain of unknown function (DUF6475)